MESTTTKIRIDKTIKEEAKQIYNALGLNMTTAINLFLRASIRENGIPFELKLDVPNEVTAVAIEEGRRIGNDDNIPGYTNMDDLKAALQKNRDLDKLDVYCKIKIPKIGKKNP